jgi:hypothetical protein
MKSMIQSRPFSMFLRLSMTCLACRPVPAPAPRFWPNRWNQRLIPTQVRPSVPNRPNPCPSLIALLSSKEKKVGNISRN